MVQRAAHYDAGEPCAKEANRGETAGRRRLLAGRARPRPMANPPSCGRPLSTTISAASSRARRCRRSGIGAVPRRSSARTGPATMATPAIRACYRSCHSAAPRVGRQPPARRDAPAHRRSADPPFGSHRPHAEDWRQRPPALRHSPPQACRRRRRGAGHRPRAVRRRRKLLRRPLRSTSSMGSRRRRPCSSAPSGQRRSKLGSRCGVDSTDSPAPERPTPQ